ncbi:MAG: response regulator [Bacteriovoracaceae bacterium]|nr:response regulator [Bacteriovoracaceae bacterium]
MSLRILLAEDEPRVQAFVRRGLEQAGMTVETTDNIKDTESFFLTNEYDVLILDRLLKQTDSLTSIQGFKKKFPQKKILVLSALSSVSHRIQGLEKGADDYLGKPFHITELIARVKSLSRRIADDIPTADRQIRVDDLTIDLDSHKAMRAGRNIELSFKEFRLLNILSSYPEKIFSRAELLNRVWDVNFDPESNVVDVTMGRLRRKLNFEGLQLMIHPQRGVGYSLKDSKFS